MCNWTPAAGNRTEKLVLFFFLKRSKFARYAYALTRIFIYVNACLSFVISDYIIEISMSRLSLLNHNDEDSKKLGHIRLHCFKYKVMFISHGIWHVKIMILSWGVSYFSSHQLTRSPKDFIPLMYSCEKISCTYLFNLYFDCRTINYYFYHFYNTICTHKYILNIYFQIFLAALL